LSSFYRIDQLVQRKLEEQSSWNVICHLANDDFTAYVERIFFVMWPLNCWAQKQNEPESGDGVLLWNLIGRIYSTVDGRS